MIHMWLSMCAWYSARRYRQISIYISLIFFLSFFFSYFDFKIERLFLILNETYESVTLRSTRQTVAWKYMYKKYKLRKVQSLQRYFREWRVYIHYLVIVVIDDDFNFKFVRRAIFVSLLSSESEKTKWKKWFFRRNRKKKRKKKRNE